LIKHRYEPKFHNPNPSLQAPTNTHSFENKHPKYSLPSLVPHMHDYLEEKVLKECNSEDEHKQAIKHHHQRLKRLSNSSKLEKTQHHLKTQKVKIEKFNNSRISHFSKPGKNTGKPTLLIS
jgi:hypothetical protein